MLHKGVLRGNARQRAAARRVLCKAEQAKCHAATPKAPRESVKEQMVEAPGRRELRHRYLPPCGPSQPAMHQPFTSLHLFIHLIASRNIDPPTV